MIKALKGFGQSSTTSSNNEGPRTSASPEWHGEQPWNHRKRMPHTCISLADFESSNSWLGQESTKCSTKFEAIICVVLFLRFCQTFAKPLGCVFACVCVCAPNMSQGGRSCKCGAGTFDPSVSHYAGKPLADQQDRQLCQSWQWGTLRVQCWQLC